MPSSAWEVAPATADDAAKGTPSGKGIAGHHVAREVRRDMVGRTAIAATLRSSIPSKIRGKSPWVMISIVVTTRVPNCSLNLKGTRLESSLEPWRNWTGDCIALANLEGLLGGHAAQVKWHGH